MKPGWNRKGPTVHLDSTHDRIDLRASKIHLELEIPSLAKGIMDFLQPFGLLYYGHLRPEIFHGRYQYLRSDLWQTLRHLSGQDIDPDWSRLKIDNFELYQQVKTSAFWLDMMRTAQEDHWRWPAVAETDGVKIDLLNGSSRLLATGMTKRNPWTHMTFLIWCPKTADINGVMDQPRLLQTDRDLHEVLGLHYDDQEYHQPEECYMGITWHDNRIIFRFFNNAFDLDFTPRTQQTWYGYMHWRRRYGPRPALKIYTNWPDLVRDSQSFWHWQIIGASQDFIDNLLPGKPGSMHWALHNHIHGTVERDHTMWIVKDDPIDLSDLVCWMDLEHTAFVDSEFRFAVYRPDTEYSTRTVDITR